MIGKLRFQQLYRISVCFLVECHDIHSRTILRESEISGIPDKRITGILVFSVFVKSYTDYSVTKLIFKRVYNSF